MTFRKLLETFMKEDKEEERTEISNGKVSSFPAFSLSELCKIILQEPNCNQIYM